MKELTITSPDFAAEGWISDRNSGYGEDISPELHMEGIVENAVSMAVTLDDLGHPIQPGYNHWVAWNISPQNKLPANLPKGSVIHCPVPMVQGVGYGRHVYRGPKPPLNWNHRYRFTVYILDTMLSLSPNSNKAAVVKAMEGHVLQTGFLHGNYQRKHQ